MHKQSSWNFHAAICKRATLSWRMGPKCRVFVKCYRKQGLGENLYISYNYHETTQVKLKSHYASCKSRVLLTSARKTDTKQTIGPNMVLAVTDTELPNSLDNLFGITAAWRNPMFVHQHGAWRWIFPTRIRYCRVNVGSKWWPMAVAT